MIYVGMNHIVKKHEKKTKYFAEIVTHLHPKSTLRGEILNTLVF